MNCSKIELELVPNGSTILRVMAYDEVHARTVQIGLFIYAADEHAKLLGHIASYFKSATQYGDPGLEL